MNPCGNYRIYAGEVLDSGQIEVRLHDVDNKARTLTMVISRAEWGSISIGASVEIVSYGMGKVESLQPLEGPGSVDE